MKLVKKLIPGLTILVFTLVFIFLQLIPAYKGITVSFLQETQLPEPTGSTIGGLADYWCTDVGRKNIGFPFRMDGYDYCGEGGIKFVPLVLNSVLYLLITYFIYKLSMKITRN